MALKERADLAEHNFRSLEEMERYLKGLEEDVTNLGELVNQYEKKFEKSCVTAAETVFKVTLDDNAPRKVKQGDKTITVNRWQKIVIPKMDQLRSNFSVVDELYEKLEVLHTLEGSLKSNFKAKHGAGSVLKGIERLRKVTEGKIATALRFLQNIATKHVPEPFTLLIEKTLDVLSKTIQHESYETFLYVHENPNGNFQFTAYIRLLNVSDEEGKVYHDLYLVFTCELTNLRKETTITYYVTLLHDFVTPGKFPPGTEIDSPKAAITVLGTLLELENFSNSLGTLPMVTTNDVTKNSFSVKDKIHSFEADSHSWEFVLVKSLKDEKEISKIVQQLYLEVKASMVRIKPKLKVRTTKRGGSTVVQFTLTNLADSSQVSVNDLDFLRTKLGIDDDKLRRIVRVINGH